MTAANTKHAKFSAHARAERHHVRTFTSRNRLVCTATLLWPYLPLDMAARPARGPDELFAPVHPSNLPYLTLQDAMAGNVKTRPGKPAPRPTGRAAERLAVRAEAAAQAPWREAIAHARVAKRAIRQARKACSPCYENRNGIPAARPFGEFSSPVAHRRPMRGASPLEGLGREERTKGRGEGARCAGSANISPGAHHAADAPLCPATPAPPPTAWHDLTLLQRELAVRLPGLCDPRCGQPPNEATPGPRAETKSPGRNALRREPTAPPGSARPPITLPPAPSAPARPVSHKPPAPAAAHRSPPPLAGRQTKTAGRNAIQREQPATPPLTRPHTLAPAAPPTLCAKPPAHDPAAPAPLNRAARHRLKYLQRRRDRAARTTPRAIR
jgi:hypothetical protein